jgi:DNA-binding transcriptional ArsR family regulator
MTTNPPRSKLDPTKILILRILKKNGTQTIRQVCDEMGGLSYSAVGNALRGLWKLGLVTESFKGSKSYWRIRDERPK